MKKIGTTTLAVALLLAFLPGMALAQLDCAAYANYPGAEPEGYAAQCLGGVAAPRVGGGSLEAPTDMAFAHDIGFVSTNVVSHELGDFPGQTITGSNTAAIFGYAYEETGTTLYAVNQDTLSLGTMDAAGVFTSVGPLTGLVGGDTVTGIAFTGDGTCYVSSVNAVTATLYTCDRTTGTLTPVGSQTDTGLLIEIVASCTGELYGHDIGTDSIYSIDPMSGAATLIGATGVDANFAQGMAFDRNDGVLYAYLYEGGGFNQYGTIDLGSGAFNQLSIDDPLGEFEGAAQTSCGAVGGGASLEDIPTASTWGLLALVLLLAAMGAAVLRR